MPLRHTKRSKRNIMNALTSTKVKIAAPAQLKKPRTRMAPPPGGYTSAFAKYASAGGVTHMSVDGKRGV